MPKEDKTNESHNNAFLNQFFAQGADGTFDQLAPVVGRDQLDSLGKGRFDLLQFLLDSLDDSQGVFAIPHDDDAPDHLAFPVQFRHPAPQIGTEMHSGDIFDENGGSLLRFEGDVLDVLDAFNVAATANVILGRADLENLPAHI